MRIMDNDNISSLSELVDAVKIHALAKGRPGAIEKIISGSGGRFSDRGKRLAKNAVEVIDSPWLDTDGRIVASALNSSLARSSFVDRFIADGAMQRTPLGVRFGAAAMAMTPAALVGRGRPIPLAMPVLTGGAISRAKCGTILVLTDEFWAATQSKNAITKLLVRAAGVATDLYAIEVLVDSSVPQVEGASALPFAVTLAAMFRELETVASSKLYLIASSDVGKYLASLPGADETGLAYPAMSVNGGLLGSLPAVVTDALDDGEALLIDADAISGDAEGVEVSFSSVADLQMTDAPVDGAQPTVSLWQTNSSGVRILRELGVKWNRSGGAVKGVNLVP